MIAAPATARNRPLAARIDAALSRRAWTKRAQLGLALIVVLWVTAIISLLAAGFSFSLRTEARLAAGAVERAQGAAAANAGITWLMAELLSPVQGVLGSDTTLSFHGFDIELQVLPENALVDLNTAPENLLANLIKNTIDELQLDGVSAVAMTDAILDWRDGDSKRRPDGAEAADYVSAGQVTGPRDGALLSVSELNQVMGMQPELFRALRPLVTVHARSTKVAPMSASARVLRAVPGLTPAQVEQFVRTRGEGGDAREAISILSSGARYLARTESRVYTLIARARAPSGVSAVRRAIVRISGSAAQPTSILAWFEDADRDDEGGDADGELGDGRVQAGKGDEKAMTNR